MARVLCAMCGGYVITGKTNYVFENGIHRHKTCPVIKKRFKCQLCGKYVDSTKDNYIYENGVHKHIKCPPDKVMSPEYRNLTDRIQDLAVEHGKPLTWHLIGRQIQSLKDKGYDYPDQLYALNWLVEKDGEYWGYGRVEKFVVHAMEYKRKNEEWNLKQQEKEKQKEQTEEDLEAYRKKILEASKPEFLIWE